MKNFSATADARLTYAIAFLAFALSYSKLTDLALRAGYTETESHVWPLVVDGLAVLAARGVMRLDKSRGYAWSLLVAGTMVSIVAAVMNQMVAAGPLPPWAAAVVAVVPPLCLPFALHLARKMRPESQDDAFTVPADVATNSRAENLVTEADLREVAPLSVAASDEADVARDDATDLHLVAGETTTSPKGRKAEFTEEERAEALRLVAAGVSQREAGRAIGASGNTVRRWVMAQAG